MYADVFGWRKKHQGLYLSPQPNSESLNAPGSRTSIDFSCVAEDEQARYVVLSQ